MGLSVAAHQTPPFTSQDRHCRRVLGQLYREQVATGCQSAAFTELCDQTDIPQELRARLLDMLVRERYLTQEQYGLVRLTEAGISLATAPQP